MVHEILPPQIGVCGRHRCFPVVTLVGANTGAGREGRNMVAGVDGPDAEHQHLRAHRLREDDADRAGPLPHHDRSGWGLFPIFR